jgi:hypothetical protein
LIFALDRDFMRTFNEHEEYSCLEELFVQNNTCSLAYGYEYGFFHGRPRCVHLVYQDTTCLEFDGPIVSGYIAEQMGEGEYRPTSEDLADMVCCSLIN